MKDRLQFYSISTQCSEIFPKCLILLKRNKIRLDGVYVTSFRFWAIIFDFLRFFSGNKSKWDLLIHFKPVCIIRLYIWIHKKMEEGSRELNYFRHQIDASPLLRRSEATAAAAFLFPPRFTSERSWQVVFWLLAFCWRQKWRKKGDVTTVTKALLPSTSLCTVIKNRRKYSFFKN